MRIAARYSHLNGLEYMLVHHSDLWDEVQDAIESVDAEACKTKISKEKTMRGRAIVRAQRNEPCPLLKGSKN